MWEVGSGKWGETIHNWVFKVRLAVNRTEWVGVKNCQIPPLLRGYQRQNLSSIYLLNRP
ncbi:hypothetical protein amyaer_1529 [Microcystis aeruginosa NIES-2481]|nr:hypothetical protein amyaer_1529 [Microcystis aeruginosa NIES-2481]